jgi:tRNA/rRNA methyltransferase
MNLGQAVAVCLWELRRGKQHGEEFNTEGAESGQGTLRKSKKRPRQAAKVKTVEMITEVMLDVLRKTGYVAPSGQALAEEKLRRMLRRFELEGSDAEVFLGMMRKIAWKVEQGK